MALTNFVDRVTTITAGWLNSVDVLWSTVFDGATTKETARTAISAVGIEDTIAELRLVPVANISNLDTIGILGHTTAGDGGGGHFYWSSSSADADDNLVTVLPTGHVGNGRWKRVDNNAYSLGGFWEDSGTQPLFHRFKDRSLFGLAADHTGNIAAPYGGTFLSEKVGTWPEKNAQVAVLSQNNRIGLLAATQNTVGAETTSCIGIAGFVYNTGNASTGRAFYADVTHVGSATASYGLEIAVNNLGVDGTANAYAISGGVLGIHMTPEGGSGYTLGDAATPAPEATAPGTLGINISAGSGGTVNKRWNLGIRFGSNAITGTDGFTGTGIAIGMAKGHTIQWMASSTILGASIRSDVSAVSSQDVGIYFSNNKTTIAGTGEASVFEATHVSSGVNYIQVKNAITTDYPIIACLGSDTNIGLFVDTKGSGVHRFRTNGGLQEQFRINHVASAVNLLQVSGAATGLPPVLSVIGSDTDIDLALTPKGAGIARSAASLLVHSATVIPAGGTTGAGLRVSSTSNFGVFFGSGAPSLSAAKGSLYLRSDGTTTNDRAYINTNGSTTWTALTTVA
jgi:hypothetical protein